MSDRQEYFRWGKNDLVLEESVKDTFDPNQKRDPAGTETGGEWTEDPNAQDKQFQLSGKLGAGFEESVRKGLKDLPPEVVPHLKDVPVELHEFIPHEITTAGMFRYGSHAPRIEIGRKLKLPHWFDSSGRRYDATSNNKDIAGTLIHEMGHAADYKMGWRGGKGLRETFDVELKSMRGKINEQMKYYTSNDGEKWAETFRLAYSKDPKAKAFGMKAEKARQIFPKSIEHVKTVVSIWAKQRSGS